MLYINTNVLKHQKLHKQAGKCEDQQQFKDILEAAMVSTPVVFSDNSPISTMTSTPIKKPSDWKPLCLFTNISDVKKLITAELEMLNLSARQLNLEINHGNWNQSKKEIQESITRKRSLLIIGLCIIHKHAIKKFQ